MELLSAAFGRWGNFAYFTVVASTLIAAGVFMSAALIVVGDSADEGERSESGSPEVRHNPRHAIHGTSRHAR